MGYKRTGSAGGSGGSNPSALTATIPASLAGTFIDAQMAAATAVGGNIVIAPGAYKMHFPIRVTVGGSPLSSVTHTHFSWDGVTITFDDGVCGFITESMSDKVTANNPGGTGQVVDSSGWTCEGSVTLIAAGKTVAGAIGFEFRNGGAMSGAQNKAYEFSSDCFSIADEWCGDVLTVTTTNGQTGITCSVAPVNIAGLTVSTTAAGASTWTCQVPSTAAMAPGQQVTLAGVTGFTPEPNGTLEVVSIVDSTHFTFIAATGTGTWGGTGTVTPMGFLARHTNGYVSLNAATSTWPVPFLTQIASVQSATTATLSAPATASGTFTMWANGMFFGDGLADNLTYIASNADGGTLCNPFAYRGGGHGIHVSQGDDANAWRIFGAYGDECALWNILDESFLGNMWIGGRANASTLGLNIGAGSTFLATGSTGAGSNQDSGVFVGFYSEGGINVVGAPAWVIGGDVPNITGGANYLSGVASTSQFAGVANFLAGLELAGSAIYAGTTTPTGGDTWYSVGDWIKNTAFASSGITGWVCLTPGLGALRTIGTLTASGTTWTLGLGSGTFEGLAVGDQVNLVGITGFGANPNGLQTVLSMPTSSSITFTATAPGSGSYGSGATVAAATWSELGGTVLVTRVVSGTTDTLQVGDMGRVVEYTNSSAVTVTVPANVFPLGAVVDLCQIGLGQVGVVASGVTLDEPGGFSHTHQQFSTISVRQRDTVLNEFVLGGDLA